MHSSSISKCAPSLACVWYREKLDTRTKIVSAGEARDIAQRNATRWVIGYFDPLLAEHTALLHAEVRPDQLLIVEIIDPPHPLLTRRARAELVAALADVNYVVMSDRQADAIDADVTRRLMDHVRQRSNGAKA